MKAEVNWKGGVAFDARSGSGHEIVIDGPPEHGGENQGARPMEFLLLGLAGCSGFDVIHILKKARQNVTDFSVSVSAERSESIPKIFEKIHLHYTVKGVNISEQAVTRAVQLSEDKYCSASVMLGKTAKLSHEITIVNTEAAARKGK